MSPIRPELGTLMGESLDTVLRPTTLPLAESLHVARQSVPYTDVHTRKAMPQSK